jgi:hypothetical protein
VQTADSTERQSRQARIDLVPQGLPDPAAGQEGEARHRAELSPSAGVRSRSTAGHAEGRRRIVSSPNTLARHLPACACRPARPVQSKRHLHHGSRSRHVESTARSHAGERASPARRGRPSAGKCRQRLPDPNDRADATRRACRGSGRGQNARRSQRHGQQGETDADRCLERGRNRHDGVGRDHGDHRQTKLKHGHL